MADVVTLGGNPFPTAETKQARLNEKQKSVVKILEDYLERAKDGQYSECAIVGITTVSEDIDTVTSEDPSLHTMITGLEILKFRLLENRTSHYRESK